MTDEVQNDAAPSSTEPVNLPNAAGGASAAETSSPVASAPDVSPSDAVEVGNAVSPAVESSTAEPASALPVSVDAGVSQADASSHGSNGQAPAEPQTFEERVEARFLALEGYLMKLPHSIAHAFSQGSAEPEELATRVLAHLFSK